MHSFPQIAVYRNKFPNIIDIFANILYTIQAILRKEVRKMTFQKAFDNLKTILQTADTTDFSGHFAIQVNLTNKDCGGIFYIEWKDNTLYVEPYDYHDRDAMVTVMAGDLVRILEGRMNPQRAMEGGTLRVEGNSAVLMAVLGAIKPVEKPAKKPAAKKETKKAEAAAPAKAAEKTIAAKAEPAKKTAKKTKA